MGDALGEPIADCLVNLADHIRGYRFDDGPARVRRPGVAGGIGMRWIESEVRVPTTVGHPMDTYDGNIVVRVCGPNDNPESDRVRWGDEPIVEISYSPDDDEMGERFHDIEEIRVPLKQLMEALRSGEAEVTP